MSNQTSPDIDEKLNELSRKIGAAKDVIDLTEAARNNAWDEVINLLGEFNLVRFLADDGYYMALQRREGQPKLDEEALEKALRESKSPEVADALWNMITVRKVSPELLEIAVHHKMIDQDVLEKCLTPGTVTTARLRQPWTADDKTRARILGIDKEGE